MQLYIIVRNDLNYSAAKAIEQGSRAAFSLGALHTIHYDSTPPVVYGARKEEINWLFKRARKDKQSIFLEHDGPHESALALWVPEDWLAGIKWEFDKKDEPDPLEDLSDYVDPDLTRAHELIRDLVREAKATQTSTPLHEAAWSYLVGVKGTKRSMTGAFNMSMDGGFATAELDTFLQGFARVAYEEMVGRTIDDQFKLHDGCLDVFRGKNVEATMTFTARDR